MLSFLGLTPWLAETARKGQEPELNCSAVQSPELMKTSIPSAANVQSTVASIVPVLSVVNWPKATSVGNRSPNVLWKTVSDTGAGVGVATGVGATGELLLLPHPELSVAMKT